jgi:hypothetical protein
MFAQSIANNLIYESMTNRQRGALHGLKAAENKAWSRMINTAGTSTADEAIAKLGDDHEHVVAWRKANDAVRSFADTIRRRA